MTSRPSPKTLLKRLASRRPVGAEVVGIIEEMIRDRNDRSAALIGASLIDSILRMLLLAKLRPLTPEEQEALFDGEDAPLGTLSAKTKLSYALGICSREERDEIDLVRLIRNQFAHSLIPMTFETGEVADVCALLKLELPPEKRGSAIGEGPRMRFIHSVVFLLAHGMGLEHFVKGLSHPPETSRPPSA